MQTSRDGILFIACREAVVEVPYQDGAHLSIGCGHNGPDVLPTDHWSPRRALAQLKSDMGQRERDVNRLLSIQLRQHEFDALVSFHYNRGNRDFAYHVVGTQTIVEAVNSSDEAEIVRLWPTFDTNVAGAHLPGLRLRREAELALFLRGDYGSLVSIPWWRGNPRRTRRYEYVVQPGDLA